MTGDIMTADSNLPGGWCSGTEEENEFSRLFDGISSWDNECTLRPRRPDMWLGLGESG
jgi:hypothetical protein